MGWPTWVEAVSKRRYVAKSQNKRLRPKDDGSPDLAADADKKPVWPVPPSFERTLFYNGRQHSSFDTASVAIGLSARGGLRTVRFPGEVPPKQSMAGWCVSPVLTATSRSRSASTYRGPGKSRARSTSGRSWAAMTGMDASRIVREASSVLG